MPPICVEMKELKQKRLFSRLVLFLSLPIESLRYKGTQFYISQGEKSQEISGFDRLTIVVEKKRYEVVQRLQYFCPCQVLQKKMLVFVSMFSLVEGEDTKPVEEYRKCHYG